METENASDQEGQIESRGCTAGLNQVSKDVANPVQPEHAVGGGVLLVVHAPEFVEVTLEDGMQLVAAPRYIAMPWSCSWTLRCYECSRAREYWHSDVLLHSQ